MNDPHVVTLYYGIKHVKSVDYDNAPQLSHDHPEFIVTIQKDRAKVTMKSHFSSVEGARAKVEPLLRAWELTAALQMGPREFEFDYVGANVIDRTPPPGSITSGAALMAVSTFAAEATHARSKYPAPPPPGLTRDEAVDLMFARFCRYREGGTTLADAGNFCLTVLKHYSGGRRRAALRYAVAERVLRRLGELTATKGGNEARKAAGVTGRFTNAERCWIEETMKRLVLRAAEVASDPSGIRQQITMADLPTLP